MNSSNQQRQGWRRWDFVPPIALGLGAIGVTTIGLTSLGASAVNPPQLDDQTQQAMVEAINDEYRARAFYGAVIDQFGSVRPFSQIVQAEDRHVQLWNFLFTQYGLPVPEDSFMDAIEAPATLQEACQMGIEAEIANVQMYDRFLEFVQEADLRAAFTQLREVSQTHHKPAFERCVNNSGVPGQPSHPGRGQANHRGGNGLGPMQ